MRGLGRTSLSDGESKPHQGEATGSLMTRRRIYKRSRNDGGVPQIHYTEDGDNDSNQSDLPLSAEAFTSLAFRLLGARTVGNFRDDFGGQVLWVYRTFAKGLAHHFPRNLKLYAEGDQEVINRMLPQAKEEFRNRLQEKLSTAVRELSEEVYKPAILSLGKALRN